MIYANVNNGVYRGGFARMQAAYEQAFDELFQALDELEARLGRQRYLLGRQITVADWRLFATLVRFDVAYVSLFTGIIREGIPVDSTDPHDRARFPV
jgi:putative glutathione S-transferase